MAENRYTPTEYAGKTAEDRRRLNHFKEHKTEKKWRKQAMDEWKYFSGEDQGWDEQGDRAALEAARRPALTLNRIAPILRLIQGARPDTETTFLPEEGNDLDTAEILNDCKKHVEKINHWGFLENDLFMRGLIFRRCPVGIYPDYRRDPRGEIGLRVRDPFTFYLDPEAKEKDRSDANHLFIELNITLEDAKKTWPGKEGELERLVSEGESSFTSGGSPTRDTGMADEYQDPASNYYDITNQKLKVYYHWWKMQHVSTKVLDLESAEVTDDRRPWREVQDEIKKQGLEDTRRVLPFYYTTVHYKTFCFETVLEEGMTPWQRPDGRPTYLSQNFPFFIWEADRIKAGTVDEILSVINPLKDPQKFYNKLSSAILHIIGTQAHSGYDYEEGAIEPDKLKDLEEKGSKPGFNVEWAAGAISQGKVQARGAKQPPMGHITMAREMAESTLDLSGVESLVSTESLGKGASGYAIDLKQRQGGNTIDWVYESFRFFQHVIAIAIKDAIQRLYNYEKVIRITGQPKAYITINEEVYDPYGGISEILNDVTSGEYDVTVSEKETTPTMRLERFRLFTELVSKGALQLPPEVMTKLVVTLMDDPELKQIIEEEFGGYQNLMMMAQQQGLAGAGPAAGPPMQQAA